jgi:uroporphyrinogen-III decarboxylase
MVNRNRGQETEGVLRGGIDAELLQQTVQAVVAAVTAATKTKEVPAAQVPVVAQASEPVTVATPVVEASAAESQNVETSRRYCDRRFCQRERGSGSH